MLRLDGFYDFFLQFGLEVNIGWVLLLVSLVNVLFCVGCVSRLRGEVANDFSLNLYALSARIRSDTMKYNRINNGRRY